MIGTMQTATAWPIADVPCRWDATVAVAAAVAFTADGAESAGATTMLLLLHTLLTASNASFALYAAPDGE